MAEEEEEEAAGVVKSDDEGVCRDCSRFVPPALAPIGVAAKPSEDEELLWFAAESGVALSAISGSRRLLGANAALPPPAPTPLAVARRFAGVTLR